MQLVLASQELLADKLGLILIQNNMLGNLAVLATMVIVGVALFGGGTCLPPLDNRAAVRAIVLSCRSCPSSSLALRRRKARCRWRGDRRRMHEVLAGHDRGSGGLIRRPHPSCPVQVRTVPRTRRPAERSRSILKEEWLCPYPGGLARPPHPRLALRTTSLRLSFRPRCLRRAFPFPDR